MMENTLRAKSRSIEWFKIVVLDFARTIKGPLVEDILII